MKKRQRWWCGSCHCHVRLTVLLLMTMSETVVSNIANDTVSMFENRQVEKFNHLTVHEYTGRVYIGAVNRIFQLSSDLKCEESVEMGPKEDSPKCPVSRICPNEHKTMTNYYNKVLAIDYLHGKLIACGSLFQGLCTTHELKNVSVHYTPANESVVANNATASTVAFIAPGPKNLSRTHVLYVGVSYTGNGLYRSDIPAVSSRSLDPANMFAIAYTGVTTGTKINLNSMSRETYPIKYIFGFSSKEFSYFVTVQGQYHSPPKPFYSKLVRICQNDVHYYSYTEVPLLCRIGETNYNLAQAAYVGFPGSELAVSLGVTAQDSVLFVAFAKSKDDTESYYKPSANSAICVYSVTAIRRKFTLNIQSCFNGEGQRGLDFINPTQACSQTQVKIDDDFCGMDVNTPLGGTIPVEAAPALQLPGVLLTSIAATSTHDYTVVFLGTSTGHLKKAVVESVTRAFVYSDIAIDEGSPVNPDMLFDNERKNIYVMTENKVTMMKVQGCQVFNTCGECLGVRDPYCGWCSLENKCSLRRDCAGAAQDVLYWLSYKNGRCTMITEVQPPQIQRTTARILNLVIDNLPVVDGEFFCAFTIFGKTLITNATRSANGVNCATPHTDSLPSILPGKHHITAKLSVRKRVGPDFVATNFTFYDCSTHTSCTQCVSSHFPCDWCVQGHRCTHDTGENCRNDILVTGVSSVGPSIRSGPGFCPRINTTEGGSSVILVPIGTSKSIEVKVENIQPLLLQTTFVCQFNIEGRVRQVPAGFNSDKVNCKPMMFSYSTQASNVTASFAVIWAGSKPLDNPENIHVLVYRCEGMASNCGICLELPQKYQCGWCLEEPGFCRVNEQCESGSHWLDRSQICPNPVITEFHPVSGPWEGGTNITITGINLGRTFADVKNGVKIESWDRKTIANCIPYEELYEKTTKIVCQVESSHNRTSGILTGKLSGYVIVKILDDYTARSAHNYSFVNPRIVNITPNAGPKAGGTRLQIWGRHMNAGSKVEAFVGAFPCNITRREEEVAECITSPANTVHRDKVRVKFDNGLRDFEQEFAYVENPKIATVDTGTSNLRYPKGIPSGGIIISVTGINLDAVRSPMMYVVFNNKDYYGNCRVESSFEMKCESPSIPHTIDDNEVLELDYGFKMDNVQEVRNLSGRPEFRKFQMFPDPKYEMFSETDKIKYYKSDYLTINGKNLDRASQEVDVIVRIGMGFCNVTSLSHSQLTCRPPTTQPPARGENGLPDRKKIPRVVVEVGTNLKFDIGRLSYEVPLHQAGTLSKPVIIGVIVGGCVLLFIVIFILIAYRRKSTESSRVLKNMQEQMDVLELRVASECKEAFAELQTEMTDLTSDLTMGGIPFLDYRTYAMKVLFPNYDNHPVLKEMQLDPLKRPYIEKGLKLFGQLIMNKTFLLLFIRTLESNRHFSMRDRVNVASLIMVSLQGKMEYCTDILKTLLAELIEKCMEGKNHPKLLLRRTESVAEKMLSSWFTFLLFKFLKECAGEPLFMLYRAIKQQVDKGPVDAITSEARYSLSEEKLIRQSIEYKSMMVFVSMSPQTAYMSGLEPPGENIETPVKVLDCDTLSQVKEKSLDAIYRNTPFSQRPTKEGLDLEWRTGSSGRLTLSDEDPTNKIEGEWKRLNTLAHYKVPDGALLTLIPKQQTVYNIPIINEKYEKSHKYETLQFPLRTSPPHSRATSPLNYDHHDGYKFWHLVKHDIEPMREGERGNKMVSEIYLTRLLATKGTLQKFVDDLFETIFSTAHRGSALPLAIKYMFDFLDDQAIQHGITDPEVVHTWKSNSLPLRFWVNLIKNPNFVFDINKSNIVDSCLSVVAQTFMDACSTSDHRLGKDSPSSKLLYAKDIPVYKEWVERYYQDIKIMCAISDQDMNAMLAEESRLHAYEFNTNVALYELYSYVVKYNDQLMQTLEEDEFSRKNKLARKLEQVHFIMSGESEA